LSYVSSRFLFYHHGILSEKYIQQPWVAILAGAGAYTWVLNDLISRVRQNDLVTSDVNRATLRLLIAVPLAYALASNLQPPLSVAIGMFLGAFPSDTIMKFLRRQATQKLDMGDDSNQSTKSQLEYLENINTAVAERFADEGVTTISQLAHCDPITLTMRCGMSFSFVTDCVSEALAWIYCPDKRMNAARSYGLRGAAEIFDLVQDLSDESEHVRKGARKTLDDFATEIKLDPDVVIGILMQIAENPHTLFLADIQSA
jgi:hypothetical protein